MALRRSRLASPAIRPCRPGSKPKARRRELCRWLWHPLAIAALNQSPDEASAAPFVRVLAEMFGPRVSDSAIGVPAVPLDELYAEPAARFVESRGGVVLRKRSACLTVNDTGHDRIARG